MNEPLTPADCDLQDFAYMPLDVRRLRDSDLAATESPEACWCAVLLWAASWHQVPAASLPDDDRVLSNLAGFGRVVSTWLQVREGALRGWVKCSDGRLYHPVVAEKANDSWLSKLKYAHGKMQDRMRKANKTRAEKRLPLIEVPSFDEWNSTGRCDPVPPEEYVTSSGKNNSSAGIPPENPLKGEGEGEVRDIQIPHTPLVHVAPVCGVSVATTPTLAGAACLAMKAEGVIDVNPSHPKLTALLEAGATQQELAGAAKTASASGKGFAYALGIIERQRTEAKKMAGCLHNGSMPSKKSGFKSARQELIEGGASAIFEGATHV